MIYFTELEKLPTYDAKGEYLGHLVDLAIDPSQNSLRVAYYFVMTPKKKQVCIAHEQVSTISVRAVQTSVSAEAIYCSPPYVPLPRYPGRRLRQPRFRRVFAPVG